MNKNLKMALAVVCLALAIMACSAVQIPSMPGGGNSNTNTNINTNVNTNTNTNTNTNANTNTNTNTNTNVNTNANNNASGGSVLLSDDFSDNKSGWGTGTDAKSLVEYVNGGLQMTVFKDNYFTYSTPDDKAYQNVHIEVAVANTSADKLATFGIMCNQQVTKDAFYYFGISPNGDYGIVKAAVAKDDLVLTNGGKWKSSNLIKPNAKSYTIGADCGSDGTLTLYVDGKKVDSVNDTSYTKGRVALFAWNAKVPSGTNVVFDNFAMTSLK